MITMSDLHSVMIRTQCLHLNGSGSECCALSSANPESLNSVLDQAERSALAGTVQTGSLSGVEDTSTGIFTARTRTHTEHSDLSPSCFMH